MNVFVNATSARLGGGITVLRHLLPALLSEDAGRNRYRVAARAEVARAIDPRDARMQILPGDGRLFFEPLQGCDVLLSPANVASFTARIPQVLLFQNAAPFDASVRRKADLRTRLRLEALRALGVLSAQKADRIVFLSEQVRALTLPQLHVAPEKTSVVHLGSDAAFRPLAQAEVDGGAQNALCVSQLYFYKNIVELIEGFAAALPQLPPQARLDIAGAAPEPVYLAQVRGTIERLGVGQRVRLLGEVPHADLPGLYARARLFLFPSTCESFPNILVEALASGAPSIVSRKGPMQEIAGEAAVYVDPFDPAEIAAQIVRLWQDGDARAVLRRRGIARAAQFSWAKTAQGMLRALEEAAA